MFRSVSALVLGGTLAIAFAPLTAVAKDATCVRTSHGVVVCGEMVQRVHQAPPRHHYEPRWLLSKHSDHRTVTQTSRDHSRKAVYQASIVDPAKRARLHADVRVDRQRTVATRDRHVEVYVDRNHKIVKPASSHAVYAYPRLQKAKWNHSSEELIQDRSHHAAKNDRSRAVVYRERSPGQARQVQSHQDVGSSDPDQDAHQDAHRQTESRDRRGQYDQDQPEKD